MGDVDNDQEREFVRRARAGDRVAFAALVDRYWNPLRAWLAGMNGWDHASEDLAQEAFLKAWTGLPGLIAEDTFRAWLFQIARNEFLALTRSRRPVTRDTLPETPDPRPGPPEETEAAEGAAALRAAVDALPVAYREVYLLWTHEGMPYPEIARVLTVTEEVARWRVCEARRRLVSAVQPFLESDPR